MSLDEIMRRWPATIGVFLRHGMLCVGCPIGIFHSVVDACDAHWVDRKRFERDLLQAMDRRPDAPAMPSSPDDA